MGVDRAIIERNLRQTQDRIAQAIRQSGRPEHSVRLVAVTKYVGVEEIRILHDLGVTHFGESRVEDAAPKIAALPDSIHWHMIGSVQRRKARDVVQHFQYVDSVDRIELAEALDKRWPHAPEQLPILMEVNVSGEESKHGFAPESISDAVNAVRAMPNLALRGVMTMAPLADDPEEVRPVFRRLAELAKDLNVGEISMGMTNDFEVAIEEGATEVRIGSALFEP